MSIKKILIICLIICCLFSLQAVVAESDGNSTDDVLTIDSNVSAYSLPDTDNQLREGSDVGSFSDLQNDLSLGGDIVLTKNYTFNNTIDTGLVNGISVPDTVNSITGSGKIVIDGSHQARIFNIHSNHGITLTGITFINANADGNGGSINSDGTLIISNCNFTNNTASGHGGAVYLGSGEGDTITNCNFEGNVAGENGGAIDWYAGSSKGKIEGSTFTDNTAKRSGGAVHWSGHYGTIRDSNFTNNIATGEVISEIGGIVGGGDGAAVLWVGSNGTVTNCIFTGNVAQNRGGAIFLHGNSTENCTNTTLSYSTFINNIAGLNGGAVDWQEGAHDGKVIYCDFTNNTASSTGGAIYWSGHNGTIVNSNFTSNKALGTVNGTGPDGSIILGGNGGAIVWKGAEGDIINSTFRLNNASRNGGAIFMQAGATEDCSNITVDGSTFIDNYAGRNGGALDWYEGAHDADLYNSVFINNTAERSGGAIYWFGHDGTIANSTFENNTAKGNVSDYDSYGRLTPGGHGGAIMWTGANGKVLNSTFRLNNASRNGGAIYMQGSTDGDCSNITVEGSRFVENYAGVNGGALDWYEGAHDSTLSNSYFENNTAARSGGAVYWFGHDGTIKNSTFINNTAKGKVNSTDSYGRLTPGGHGGAIMWTGANGKVLNSTFRLNNASRNGGAIYMQGSTEGDCSNITVDGGKFIENYAGINGGALDWYEGAHDSTLSNSIFINNTAERAGGAVYWFGHDGTIVNSTFESNTAKGNVLANDSYGRETYGGHGGAIIWTGANGKILNSTFTLNNASRNGGAIYMQGSTDEGDCINITVDGCEFVENYAGINGGAVDWYEGAHDATLSNSYFANNTARRSGGAVYWYGHRGTIKNSTFVDNQALGLVNASSPYGYNTTGGDGGAVIWTGSDGLMDNCTFINNHAAKRGGAMYLQGGEFENCTNVTINNGIFKDNRAETNGGAVDFHEGATDGYIIGSTFDNNTAATGNGGSIFWNGNKGQVINSSFSNNHARFDGGSVYIEGNDCLLANSTFDSNTAGDDGGAIFWTGQRGMMYNITANNNRGISTSDALDESHSKGGTIIITGSNMAIDQLVVTNSFANEEAGGLFLTGNNVNVTNAIFTKCSASMDGTAQNTTRGGGAVIIGNNTRLVNVTIEDSQAQRGGAIYWEGHNGYAYNVTANRNYATNEGGAFFITGENCQIYKSEFTNNVAGDDGGAINWEGDNGHIEECNFENNTGLSMWDQYENRYHTTKGGAVSITGDNLEILNSNFTDSTAKDNGYHNNVGGTLFITGENVKIDGCNFNNSVSEGSDGGTIYIIGNHTDISNSTFSNSTARAGGAIYIEGIGTFIGATNFTETSAKSGSKYNSNNLGGAIYIKGKDTIVSHSNFENSSAYNGGMVYIAGDNGVVMYSSLNNGYAAKDGGAVYSTGSHGTVSHSNFTNNLAELSGGGIYWYGGSSSKYNTVDGCIFTNNTAHGNTTDKAATRGGGAIYWSEGGTRGTVKNSEFYYNSVQSTISWKVDGGAILWDKSTHALVDNCTFVGDFVTTDGDSSGTGSSDVWAQGGAMYLRPNGNYTVSNCHFENCSSSKEAGALYIQSNGGSDRKALIVNSTFINNFAEGKGHNNNGGGAIQVKQCHNVQFVNVTFINNTANKGGALSVFDNANNFVIDGATFIGNKADRGSAISVSKSFTLKNAVLLENRATTVLLSLDFNRDDETVDILMKGKDNRLNAMYVWQSTVTCQNVTYWTNDNIYSGKTAVTSDPQETSEIPVPEKGVDVIVEIFDGDNNKLHEGIYATDENGKIHLNLSDILTDPYSPDNIYVNTRIANEEYYTMLENTTRIQNVYINASALDTIFHRNTTVTANITAPGNGTGQAARGIVSVYIDDIFKGNMTIENSKGSLENILTNFTADKFFEVGNHTVFLKYWGDANFGEANTTISFNITKAQSNLTVTIDDLGYDLHMNFTIFDDWDGKAYWDANGTATVEFYSESDPTSVVRFVDVRVVNGFASAVVHDLLPRNYTIKTTYHDDHNYNSSVNLTKYSLPQKEYAAVFLNVSAYDIMVDDTIYINVTIVPPEGYPVPGNVTIYLDNIAYNLPLINGTKNATATFNISNLTAGVKKVIAFYAGSKLLEPAIGEADFTVHKYNTTLSANVTNITVIQNEIINITLLNDTTGVVSVIVDGKEYFGRIENGTVSIELPKLPAGEYNVTLYYEGDDKYNNVTNYTVFYVSQVAPDIIIDVDNVTYGNETLIVVTLPEDATGNVTVKINDTYYVFDTQNLTDGKAILPGVVLPAGNYTVEVTYSGDENYAVNTNSTNFAVYKVKSMLNITVEDIYYGEEANITVTVLDGVTGNVTIKINGTDKIITLPIVDGKVNWTVGGLAVGNYVVIANYSGNANYTDAAATDDFNVLQIGTVLVVDVHNIPVWDTEYVNVTIKDVSGNIITNATGNVTININGVDYTAEIKDGVARFNTSSLTVGHKSVLVLYDGDRNLTGNRSKAEFDVTQRVPEVNVTALNITVDQEGKITIHIPANATGFVILSGNFTKRSIYVDEFINGVAEITLNDLAVGNYSVHIKYIGDTADNYTVAENDTTFKVDSINTTISINVESIDYGNNANITVTVNNNATGYITIRINETRNITLPIVDGKVNWIVEGLAADNYTVYANYSGDKKFNANKTNKTFEVRQISPNVEIIQVDSTAGENATVTVRVDSRVTENVTIEVDGKQYSMAVDENGIAVFTTNVLENGTYTIVASYPGDRNFTVNSTDYTFTTNRTSDYVMNITASDIYVGNNTNITVSVPVDATGEVIIELNGTNYTATISQGKAVLNNISTLKEGVYIVTAYFGNDKYVNKTASTRFTVSKVGSPIKVDVENILYVDDTAYINVTVPDDNAGNVTIEIDGKVYGPVSVTDGVARFVVSNLTYGNKTVAVTYSGTDKYVANFTTANLTVSKRTPIVNVTNITILYGKDAVINITGPSDRNGNLIVTVGDADYAVNMVGGNATLTVKGLSVGNYTVSVTYIENDKYVYGTASGWVNVTAKGTSAINITVEDVYYVGEEIVITLTPVNSTGNLSVTINGKMYNITNNIITLANGLPEGTYEIVAVLDEDEYYYGSSANATFNVVKKNMTITVNETTVPATIYVDSKVTFTANLNETVTGDVVFTINGANYTVHITDSNVATIEYTPVNNDTITVVARFMGNDKYNGNVSDPQEFNVNRIPTDINVTVKTPVTYGEDAVITVELNETLNTTVKLSVDGKEYDVAIINGKGGLNVSGLNSGDHEVNVTYIGDKKYEGSRNSTTFTVDNATLVADVTAFNVTVDENTKFVINVTDDFNGNVSIKVGDKVLYNGSVKTLVISDKLPAGDKTATVVFYGDSNYNELTLNDVNFTVSRNALTTVNLTIDDVTYPANATAVINVSNFANGTVKITVNTKGTSEIKVFNGTVTNGVARVNLTGLAGGDYEAIVEFFSSDEFNNNATASDEFRIYPNNSLITITKDKNGTYYVGEDVEITFTVTNSTGTLKIYLNGNYITEFGDNPGPHEYCFDGLGEGSYTVTAELAGDRNYTGDSTIVTFVIVKNNVAISVNETTVPAIIYVGSPVNITANLNETVTGDVVFTINGANYTVHIVDSNVATIEYTPVNNDTITVVARFMDNEKYNGNVSDPQEFNVNRIPTDINVTVKTPVTYGEDAVITVELNETLNTTVKLSVDGKEYDVAIINGKGGLNVSGLNSDDHEVNVTYAGDDKYAGSNNSTRFTVDNATLAADVTAFNVTVEQNTTFVINGTDDFNGNVSIKVGDKVLYNGSAKTLILADVLPAGDKTATVVFYGDSNYNELTLNDVKFTVSRVAPSIDVIIEDVTYPDKAVAFINVGNNANGTVNVTVDGKVFSGNVSNGVAQVDLTNLSAGNKVADVEFFATDDYNDNATASAKFIVSKANTTLDVEFKPVYVNETQVINITVNNTNATGNVIIMIDGKNYTATLTNGRANFTTDLLPYGNHTLTVIYEGDKNLTGSWTSETIEVLKLQSNLTISVTNVTTASDETIEVSVTPGATGSVVITVDGKDYHVDLDNGVATLVLSDLANKTYTVHAKYLGDENYTACEGDASFNVAKVNSTVSVKVENITVGDVAVVNITVTADATGNVTVEIVGVGTYTVPVADGTGVLVVKDLKVDNYTVKVTYNGDAKYLPSNNETTFKVSKLDSDDIKVIDQGNRTVVITVPGNEGNVTVKIGNETYNATVVNGTAVVTLTNATPGEHEIEVIYSGDENHTGSNTTGIVHIPKYDTPIDVAAENIYVGDVAQIIVTLPENATGSVTIEIEGVTYTNSTIVNGVATFNVENLTYGVKTVAVSYSGDYNYTSNFTSANFTVSKRNSTVNVTVTATVVGEDAIINVTIPADATGYVIVNVDGVNYTVNTTDGKGLVAVSGLLNATHTVHVTYIGDDKYLPSENETTFGIAKLNSTITVTADNIIVGDVAVVNITVLTDATGNVTVEIVGVGTYTVPVAGGTGVLVVKDLKVGTYTVKVTYNGDDKYLPSNNETTFKVSKADSDDIKVVDQGNGTVVITVPGEDGNVTVKVGNETYNATVVNGTAVVTLTNATPGEHEIEVIYSGDDNHNGTSTNATVNIPKYETPISIEVANSTVGNITTVTVNVPKDVKDNVTVSIDGKTYSAKPDAGKAVFEIEGLIAGNKTVTAIYTGDDWFVANFTVAHFKVDKVVSSVNVTGDVINVGENATITISAPKDYNGTAVVNVDGKNYTVSISNGVGQLEVTGLANGTYDVKVTLLENDKYLGSDNDTAKVLVNKVSSSVTVNVDNITVGDVAVVNITVLTDATGNVTVEIVGVGTYTLPVAGGTGVLVVKDLKVGTYTVKVTYNGDGKYLPSNNETTFKVSKVDSDDIKVVDQGNGTVVITVPGEDGNVTVKVGNKTYNATVVNGTAVVTLTNVTPGEHEIEVIYSGDENHNGTSTNATVNMPKYDTPISIEVTNSTVGNVTTVTVNVPKDVKDNVTVSIDGKTYSVKPVDGKAVFEIEGLIAGNKTVTAIYTGDDWFVANSTIAHFKVDKVASSVNVTGDVINVGESATISITAPKDYNGTAVVNVDGKNYTVSISNGVGELEVTGLANGTYDVKVTLLENDKYLGSDNNSAKVLVNKVSSSVTVNVDNITVGDVALINITVPTDATGNVTVEIVGVGTYTVYVANGTGVLVVKDLKVDTYTVKVTYNGDGKYLPSNNETTFKVSKVDSDDIKVVDQGNGTVVITVPGEDGNVTVKVGNKTYNATVVNGTAVVTLDNLTPGEHEIEVIYSGDDNHTGASTNATVNIPKYETPMSIEVSDGKVDEKITVTVNVPDGLANNVTVEINGKTYSTKPVDGKAVFEIEGLLSGNKTVTATYDGDDNYVANSTTDVFTVDKNPAPISATVDNSTPGKATIEVTLPSDATGYVIVNVNGTDYGINLTAGEKSVTVPIEDTGDYTAVVTYLGDEKYLGNSTTVGFHASSNKTDPNIASNVENVPVGNDVVVTVTVPQGGDGNVTITIGNKTVTAPVSGGQNNISISGVEEGTHDVVIEYSGNDQFKPQTVTDKVTVFKSIIAEDLTRGWDSPYDYKAEFLDSKGHVLANTDVQFIVNGKTYTVKTDIQGIARLDKSKLPVGEYEVTIINPVTGEQDTAKTTIVKRLIENKDITMDFVDGTYYVVRAIGDDGKPVGAGEFVQIHTHTISYSCKTDKDGYARLKINLNPDTYPITAEYKNTKVQNTLVVKQTLKLVKKTVKAKKGKKLVLKAKLKWTNGKPIKGKKIVFKLKGKKYSAKTNSKGIAKVTIKKKDTKKLKKGKKYTYSAKYLTNKVKGKVKVKK